MQFSKDYGLAISLTPALTGAATKSFWKHKFYKKPLQFITFSNCWPENITILNLLNIPYETVILNSASQVKPQEAKGGKIKSFTLVLFIPSLRHCYKNTWKLYVCTFSWGTSGQHMTEGEEILSRANVQSGGWGTGQGKGGRQMGKGSREQMLWISLAP